MENWWFVELTVSLLFNSTIFGVILHSSLINLTLLSNILFVKSHRSLQKRLEAQQWQSSLLGTPDCSLYFGVIGKFSFISNTILVFQDSRDPLSSLFSCPLAFNSLCLPLVKITKSCKKRGFLSSPANSLGCHDLMELAGD